jgi:predicted phage terminase large subunit-like protein
VVIGQRVHEEDLTADWLAREGEYVHHIELAMEYSPEQVRPSQVEPCAVTGEGHEWRTERGALLAQERFPRPAIDRLKIDLGPYAYASQFDQRPTPRAGMVLNPAWLVDRPSGLDTDQMDIVQAWDLNFSEKDSSDWTVGITAAVERTGDLATIHLLDIFAEHLAESRHDQELAKYIATWKPLLIGIEKRAVEKQGATQELIRGIQRLLKGRHEECAIEPVEADTDKVSRALIIAGRAKAGLITTDRKAPWWHDLSNEMSRFPRSQHDDRIDALAHLVRLVLERLMKIRTLRTLMAQPVTVRVRAETTGGFKYRQQTTGEELFRPRT